MIAIFTKYIPSTTLTGSRIKAFTTSKHSVTIPYPHELSHGNMHRKAARMLCEKMGWHGTLAEGEFENLRGISGYVFVFVGGHDPLPVLPAHNCFNV